MKLEVSRIQIQLQKYFDLHCEESPRLLSLVHEITETLPPLRTLGKKFQFQIDDQGFTMHYSWSQKEFFSLFPVFFIPSVSKRDIVIVFSYFFLSHDPSVPNCKYFLPNPTTNCSVTFIIVNLYKAVCLQGSLTTRFSK